MPGMNSGPSPASPILVSAFRSALLHQSLIIALIFLLVLIAWGASRTATGGQPAAPAVARARGRGRCCGSASASVAARRPPAGAAADGGRDADR